MFPPCSSPPSVALRPSRPVSRGAVHRCGRRRRTSELSEERARPWSRRAPRALCWRAHERMTGLHTGARIATIPRDAPAHCSAFAKTRRVVAGDEGGRVRHETIMQSRFRPSSGRQCVAVSIVRSGCTRLQLERIEPFHTGALIATLHRATPARRGMFGASSPVTRRSHPNAKRRCNSIGSEGLSARVPRT